MIKTNQIINTLELKIHQHGFLFTGEYLDDKDVIYVG
jgi:hypothetical protein